MSDVMSFVLFSVACLVLMWLVAASHRPKGGTKDLWKWVWSEPDEDEKPPS